MPVPRTIGSMAADLVRFKLGVERKIVRLWLSRGPSQRTFLKLHDFPADLWAEGIRLGETSIEHRLAVLKLLSGFTTAPGGAPPKKR
ncbi:MAG: hypothetical protein JWQ88_3462 [Rhodoferax sp.]|nr:hypothetical protein [Rhodoferax sp.]